MKRFECRSCNDYQCAAECADTPKTCLRALGAAGPMPLWFSVGMPDKLPKLTAEALAARGIEWPDWAVCAVVDQDGTASFSGNPDVLVASCGHATYWDTCAKPLPGEWDASDWQNSKIMRPEMQEVLDWCRVGEWIYNRCITHPVPPGFAQVKSVEAGGHLFRIKYQNGRDDVLTLTEIDWLGFFAAHVRPWTGEEAVGKIVRWTSADGGVCYGAITYTDPRGLCDCGAAQKIPLLQLTDTDRYSQPDGSPCGVLEIAEEHNHE